ncbi:MAG: TIGR00341 family protein, partial [Polyangiaceae bacterium]|nr:TIGR00341 family protein [Polyangiaceae bacterium]
KLKIHRVQTENEGREEVKRLAPLSLMVQEGGFDSVLRRSIFGGPALLEARKRRGATLIYRAAEPPVGFAWRRVTENLTEFLPPISDVERVQVLGDLAKSARGNKDFFFLMVVASLIAIAGLLANSTAVVIGAMLVAPLMQPIVGLAMGVAVGSPARLRRSARAVSRGAATAIAVALVVSLLFPIHDPPPEVLARTSPNLLDLLVALAAGAAASYAAARKSISGALPGVAISVALVPPLCVVGFGIATGEWWIARGSLLLFLTNLASIILVSSSLFMLFGFRPTQEKRSRAVRWGLGASILGLIFITIPLALTTYSSFESRLIEWRLHQAQAHLSTDPAIEVEELDVVHKEGTFTAHVHLLSAQAPSTDALQRIERQIQEKAKAPIKVEFRVVQGSHFR